MLVCSIRKYATIPAPLRPKTPTLLNVKQTAEDILGDDILSLNIGFRTSLQWF